MRKLSELYGLVLERIGSDKEKFICDAISVLYGKKIISDGEHDLLKYNFKSKKIIAVDKFNADSLSLGWWPRGRNKNRIAFLKHLIKLCKEQDI